MKQGREQERDQPGAREKYHNLDHHWESASGKESAIEAKDRELHKSYREDVPKLQHEQNLFSNFESLQLNGEQTCVSLRTLRKAIPFSSPNDSYGAPKPAANTPVMLVTARATAKNLKPRHEQDTIGLCGGILTNAVKIM